MNICPACRAGRLQRRSMPYLEWHGKELLIVDQMPALVCDVCGERAYDHEALETLQQLLWSKPVGSRAVSSSRSS